MKKALYTTLLTVLTGLLAVSCYKEAPLKVEKMTDKYGILTDTPSDPIKHAVYELYQKYGTVVIVNPSTADYKFNFKDDNGITIKAPEQTATVLKSGLEFLDKALFSLYPEDFLKKNLPFSIILADTVKMSSYGETYVMSSYASSGFLAVGGINKNLKNMTPAEMITARASLNSDFWGKYMSSLRGLFKIPDSFSRASEEVEKDIFGSNGFYLGDKNPKDIDFYKYGLISYDPEISYVSDEEDFYSVYAPNKDTDLKQWMNFVFSTKPEEIEDICRKYPVMNKKYGILRDAMLHAGFDITKLKL